MEFITFSLDVSIIGKLEEVPMLTAISVSINISVLVFVAYLLRLVVKQKRRLDRFQGVVDVEAEHARTKGVLEAEKSEINRALTKLYQKRDEVLEEKSQAESKLASLNKQLTTLEDEVNIQNHGLYQPKYDLEFSTELKNRLDRTRKNQKLMIRKKTAVICSTNWTVDGSKASGTKMANRQIQLMARAFNGECDSIIPKVRYNNYWSIVDRMTEAYRAINKLGELQSCRIQESYFNLKIEELAVVHEYQEQLQFEKEEKQRIKEQIREDQRAQRELKKALLEIEKEEKRYHKAMEKARQDIEQATGKTQKRLQLEIQRLNGLLRETQKNRERAMSRVQMTQAGHVYIISNIGSFGENIYKIGMTRRLEPTDSVRELGDDSVPFHFDIHAMIYSEDASALENHLHGCLEERSVNRINVRCGFFNVGLEEIEKLVREYNTDAYFIRVPPAEEFRKTEAIVAQERSGDSGDPQ